MAIVKTPTEQPFPVRGVDQEALPNGLKRYTTMPTADNVRTRKLFGLPTCSALTGEELTNDTISFYIQAAISEIEHILDLYIAPVTFEERHDYQKIHFASNHAFLKLNHGPILDIEKFEMLVGHEEKGKLIEWPREFLHVLGQEQQVQIRPIYGVAASAFLFSQFSGNVFHSLRAGFIQDWPGGISVKYRCGFPQDKLPVLLAQIIETRAAINLLSQLGPVLFPNTSVSISIDGTGQSTGNLGPKFLDGRMDQLEKEYEKLMDAAKGYYQKKYIIDYI